MAEDTLSPELQQKIQTLQALGAQLQNLAQQRQQMELLKSETDRAHKALEGLADDAPVYRNVGTLLVRDDRTKALTRLGDESETLGIRLKRAKDQEAELDKRFTALQTELRGALGQ